MSEAVYGHDRGWTGPTILEPLPAPPPAQIEAPGGRLVTVHTVRPTTPHQSHPAVILAWARLAGSGGWTCLMVWGGWRRDAGGRERPSARWGWCRFRPELVGRLRPWPDQNPGLRWFGRHSGSEFESAYAEAAASLPEGMRAAALECTAELGPGWP